MPQVKVWAPRCASVAVRLEPHGTVLPMERLTRSSHVFVLPQELPAGQRYFLIPDDGIPVPDPRTRRQPQGVHGPSEVVDPNRFIWKDTSWFSGASTSNAAPALKLGVIYELHVGTFSAEGTFTGAIAHLDHPVNLGVSTIELMPISPMPGARGWGYDGVSLMAPYEEYGSPEELVELVNAAHERGLAVCLDVVFNHFGPDGNYTGMFGNYVTSAHHTPWGDALNLDGDGSEHVRAFIIDALEQWVRDYHIDAFRLDAVDWLIDTSPTHILAEISDRLHALGRERGREVVLIAESDANMVAMTAPTSTASAATCTAAAQTCGREAADASLSDSGAANGVSTSHTSATSGRGMDMQWVDDVHHALHVWLTGERNAYYSEYTAPHTLGTVLTRGFWHDGVWDEFLGRNRGTKVPANLDGQRFVVFDENHDQVGNRLLGDRPSVKLSLGQLALSRALVVLSHFTPMLFMGEEWATRTPFPYFSDHGPAIGSGIAAARAQEFSTWDLESAYGSPVPPIPDPQAAATFASAKLNWEELENSEHRRFFEFMQALITLRRTVPDFSSTDRSRTHVHISGDSGWIRRGESLIVFTKAVAGGTVAAPVQGLHLACSWDLVETSTEAVHFTGAGVAVFISSASSENAVNSESTNSSFGFSRSPTSSGAPGSSRSSNTENISRSENAA